MNSFNWISSTVHDQMPSTVNPVFVGNDLDGSPLYVGRAHHKGDLLPAKLIPNHRVCYVPYADREVSVNQFEYLSGSGFSWEFASNGNVSSNSVSSGKTSSGESLYVGRARHDGIMTPGKVHPSHGTLYLSYGGREHGKREYEVLVWKPEEPPVVHRQDVTVTQSVNQSENHVVSTCCVCNEERPLVGQFDCRHICLCRGCLQLTIENMQRDRNNMINCFICRASSNAPKQVFYC